MRHLVLALLIALLPVRGWMGSAMAAGPLPVAAAATVAATSHMASEASSATPHECPGHAAAAAPVNDAATSSEPCRGCSTCGLCVATALPTVPVLRTAALPMPAPHAPASIPFASAEPAPGFKPPIA